MDKPLAYIAQLETLLVHNNLDSGSFLCLWDFVFLEIVVMIYRIGHNSRLFGQDRRITAGGCLCRVVGSWVEWGTAARRTAGACRNSMGTATAAGTLGKIVAQHTSGHNTIISCTFGPCFD